MAGGRATRWRLPSSGGAAIAFGVLLALIVVPFLVWGDALEAWTREALDGRGGFAVALLGSALLTLDVVLPVPSSAIGMLLGASLGFAGGTLAGTVGLTLGCVLGYGIGGWSRVRGGAWGVETDGRAATALRRHGLLALVVLRPVPVLAEASIVVAGALGLPFLRVLLATAAANLAVSAAYAAIGASLPIGVAGWLALTGLLCAALAVRSILRAWRRSPR